MNQIHQSFKSLYNSQNQCATGTLSMFNTDISDMDEEDIKFAKEEREQGEVLDEMRKRNNATDAAVQDLVSIFSNPDDPLGKMKKPEMEKWIDDHYPDASAWIVDDYFARLKDFRRKVHVAKQFGEPLPKWTRDGAFE